MTWLSFSSTPNLKDVVFDAEYNFLQFGIEPVDQMPRIWLKSNFGMNPLLFLYRLRFAVDEAIKHNLKEANNG